MGMVGCILVGCLEAVGSSCVIVSGGVEPVVWLLVCFQPCGFVCSWLFCVLWG